MNTSLFSLAPLLSVFVIVLLLFLQIPSSVSNNDLFTDCSSKFVCGNITADFPFWGTGRPPACGIPELELKCENSIAKMKINEVAYRVLEINQDIEILRIAREDYLVGLCPPQFANSTFNPMVFESVNGYTNLTFIYGCNSAPTSIPIPGVFSCKINQVNYQSGYILPGANGPGECYGSVFVPVSADFASSVVNLPALEQNLKEGFEVRWKVDRPACEGCTRSSGVCGIDYATSQTTCYCPNQSSGSKTCVVPGFPPTNAPAIPAPGSSRIGKRHKIAIGISAAVATIIAFSVIAICYTRRESSSSGISMNFRVKTLQHVDRLETFMMDYRSLTPKRYSYSDIKKLTNSFTNILGQGGFGNVYKGKLPDGRLVAVKVLKESKGDGEEFMNEVASISRTSHVNIVTLLGFCYERSKRALIYEFMPKGSLDKFISYKGSPLTNCRLEWKKISEIAVGIARGLEYLHRGCNTRIVHFDIKPHNILLDEDFCPKISDFGLAKLCKSKVSKISMIGTRGTPGYTAPEVFCRNFGVTYKSDVYSYGMMVLEMVGERKDFDIESLETSETYFPDWFYKHLEPGEISRVHESITEDEEEIVKKMILVGLWCIQTNPSDRPSMTKVVEMLEGSLEFLQIPPRPFLSSPKRSPQEESSSKSSLSSPKRSPKEESSTKSSAPRLSL